MLKNPKTPECPMCHSPKLRGTNKIICLNCNRIFKLNPKTGELELQSFQFLCPVCEKKFNCEEKLLQHFDSSNCGSPIVTGC